MPWSNDPLMLAGGAMVGIDPLTGKALPGTGLPQPTGDARGPDQGFPFDEEDQFARPLVPGVGQIPVGYLGPQMPENPMGAAAGPWLPPDGADTSAYRSDWRDLISRFSHFDDESGKWAWNRGQGTPWDDPSPQGPPYVGGIAEFDPVKPAAPVEPPAPPPAAFDYGQYFDPKAYLAGRPDVVAAGVDPLKHFEEFGWREDSDPSPFFDSGDYLANNPDVAAAGVNPLQHYLLYGKKEGRSSYGTPVGEDIDAELKRLLTGDFGGRSKGAGLISDLLANEKKAPTDYLNNLKARGVITQSGFDRGMEDIAGQETRAKNRLAGKSDELFAGNESNIRNQLNELAGSMKTTPGAQEYRLSDFGDTVSRLMGEFMSGFGEKVTGGEPIFTTTGLGPIAGAPGGSTSTGTTGTGAAPHNPDDEEKNDDWEADPIF